MDLENDKQPMRYSQGNEEYGLVYNGELYSTSELRTELESLGHSFLGHSDTEGYFLQVNYWLQKFNIRIVSLAFAQEMRYTAIKEAKALLRNIRRALLRFFIDIAMQRADNYA